MVHAEGTEPVAIIGMAVRVPGAADTQQFWRNLVDGVESVTHFTREQELANGAELAAVDDPSWVHAAPVIADFDHFDAGLFGMTPREAEITDPQHRLLLESCYATLEDAGYDPARYDGAIGMYAGSGGNNYMWLNVNRNRRILESQRGGIGVLTGNQPSYLATGVSYKLDLRGPSLTVQTACSTSLVAIHLACEALRNCECEMALAGGVSLEIPHGVGYFGVDGFTSPDGRCRPFDAKANGTVWGSGIGVVLLKRLSDAIADGDHVRAVVLGNAINNDGAGKVGFSAPGVNGQMAAVAQAVGMAGVDPRTIGYVEAHGTGTALGDPIEVAALSTVYAEGTTERGWCGLGSVKSNIGHLSQAAGVVSVIKAVLAMEHGIIPPTINFDEANPAIDFADTPFYLADTVTKWDAGGRPRRCGVSSFGVGGTNAHVVLEEAPRPAPEPREPQPAHLLRVSARSAAALAAATERLAGHLAVHPQLHLADIAHTLGVGRPEHAHRAAVIVRDLEDAVEGLRDPRRRQVGGGGGSAARVAFLFSGQGSQYAGMSAELYRTQPVFAAVVDECAGLLDLDRDIRDVLFAAGNDELRQTSYTQPALFVVECALAGLWGSWGVRPAAMIGHSIGEYVAATLAGVFELGDALRLVTARGALMQSMPAGSMLAVQLDEPELTDRLPAGVTMATVNGPGSCVVAGPTGAVAEFAATLAASGIASKALRTSHAFHSAMMEPILDEFTALVASVPRRAPRLRFVSNVTGDWITEEQARDPGYWAAHLRRPVRFGAGLASLLADGPLTLVECGPGRQLAGLARAQLPAGAAAPLTSLPGEGDRLGDTETMYGAAGALWVTGVPVSAVGGPAMRVPLPTYPFERKRYWVEPDPQPDPLAPAGTAAAPRGPLPLEEWFAVPTWRQLGPDARREPLTSCLVFAPDGELPARLRAAGVTVTEVRPGTGYAEDGGGFTVRPGERADYDRLLDALRSDPPTRIVHAFAATDPDPDPQSESESDPQSEPRAAAGVEPGAGVRPGPGVGAGEPPAAAGIDEAWAAQERGFFSLLWLTQALAAAGLTDGVRLDVVSAGTMGVLGGDLTRPEHATVAGIARVVPLELPGLAVRLIDADPADPYRELVAELSRPGPAEVAVRGGRRWTVGYEQVTVPAVDRQPVRDGGRYLVTGGLGGIGITIAEDLARRVKARLVLLSRSGLPPREDWDTHLAVAGGKSRAGRAILAIRRMERAGAQVLAIAADVTDPRALAGVRAEIEAAFGGLDGIVHAAGVAGGGMAEVKDRVAAEAVLAPKLAGTLALRHAFGDLPLDFVALCSSVTAVCGDFGQVDYCAANNFLDAHASGAHGWRAPVVSHNWAGWAEVGMAVEVAAPAGLGGGRGPVAEPVDHPILTSRSGAQCHGLVSAGTHWVLDQHRIGGVPVVPGTAHLECVRAAFAACRPAPDPSHVVELRDVAFLKPFAVPDSAEYRVAWEDGEFQVLSRIAGRSEVHARGGAGWVSPEPAATVDLAAIRGRCRPIDDGHGFGQRGRTSMVTFGPRWGGLREHLMGEGEELALIGAPGSPAEPGFVLEPALLDVATAFGRGRGAGTYLPLGYGRVVVRSALPATFYSHLRYQDSGGDQVVAADLTLCDESGRVLVEVYDFVLRRVDQDAVAGGLATAGTAADGAATAAPATAAPEGPALEGPALEAAAPEAAALEAIAGPGGLSGLGGPAASGGAAGPDGAASPAPSGMIRPADGAEAFRRALAGDLGPRIVISRVPVADLFARRVTATELAGTAEAGATGIDGAGAVDTAGDADYAPPRTELETVLADLWSKVLGIDRVGVHQDFFALGGNSLVAVQLIAQARKATGVRLPMRVLFDAPTVAELAVHIQELGSGGSGPETTIPRLSR